MTREIPKPSTLDELVEAVAQKNALADEVRTTETKFALATRNVEELVKKLREEFTHDVKLQESREGIEWLIKSIEDDLKFNPIEVHRLVDISDVSTTTMVNARLDKILPTLKCPHSVVATATANIKAYFEQEVRPSNIHYQELYIDELSARVEVRDIDMPHGSRNGMTYYITTEKLGQGVFHCSIKVISMPWRGYSAVLDSLAKARAKYGINGEVQPVADESSQLTELRKKVEDFITGIEVDIKANPFEVQQIYSFTDCASTPDAIAKVVAFLSVVKCPQEILATIGQTITDRFLMKSAMEDVWLELFVNSRNPRIEVRADHQYTGSSEGMTYLVTIDHGTNGTFSGYVYIVSSPHKLIESVYGEIDHAREVMNIHRLNVEVE